MTKTQYAMKAQGLKYFSALTPKQKDKSVLYVSGIMAGDVSGLLLPMYKQIFNPNLEGCKMFWYADLKVWIPININDFKAKNLQL